MRTSAQSAPRQRLARRLFFLATTLAAAGVLFVPALIVKPSEQPAMLLLAQVVIAGVLLGVGRQGADLLLLRTVAISAAGPVGWLAGAPHTFSCAGLYDCYRALVVGVVVVGVIGSIILTMVSVPTTLVWNKGAGGLRPEFTWRVPRTGRQWVVLTVVGVVLLAALYLSLGIPAY